MDASPFSSRYPHRLRVSREVLPYALELLPIAASPWRRDAMCARWSVPAHQADQIEAELLYHQIVALDDDGNYTMTPGMRATLLFEQFLTPPLSEERARQALELVARWFAEVAARDDLAEMAEVAEQLSSVLMLLGASQGTLAALRVSLVLTVAAGAVRKQASIAWALGSILAQQGDLAEAVTLLEQATLLAEQEGMRQAPTYRARYEEVRERYIRDTR